MIRKIFFKTMAKVNKVVLPRMSKRDITRLSKMEKVIVAFRYWVTLNALE